MAGFALVDLVFIFLGPTDAMMGSLSDGVSLSTFAFFGGGGACCWATTFLFLNNFIFCLTTIFESAVSVLLHNLLLWTSLCGSSPWTLDGGDGRRWKLTFLFCPLLFSKNLCLFLGFLCLASCQLLVGLFCHDFDKASSPTNMVLINLFLLLFISSSSTQGTSFYDIFIPNLIDLMFKGLNFYCLAIMDPLTIISLLLASSSMLKTW